MTCGMFRYVPGVWVSDAALTDEVDVDGVFHVAAAVGEHQQVERVADYAQGRDDGDDAAVADQVGGGHVTVLRLGQGEVPGPVRRHRCPITPVRGRGRESSTRLSVKCLLCYVCMYTFCPKLIARIPRSSCDLGSPQQATDSPLPGLGRSPSGQIILSRSQTVPSKP